MPTELFTIRDIASSPNVSVHPIGRGLACTQLVASTFFSLQVLAIRRDKCLVAAMTLCWDLRECRGEMKTDAVKGALTLMTERGTEAWTSCKDFVGQTYYLKDFFFAFDVLQHHEWLTSNSLAWRSSSSLKHRIYLPINASTGCSTEAGYAIGMLKVVHIT